MAKRKVFVSVPMNGKEDKLIERAINVARVQYLWLKNLKLKDVEFIDAYHNVYKAVGTEMVKMINNGNHPKVNWLGGALGEMAECNEIIFGINWEKSNGCNVEKYVADMYGIPYVTITKEDQQKIADEMREKKMKEVKKLKEKGMTCAEIAKETGYPESSVRRWLKG